MDLDALYGAGAWTELQAALNLPSSVVARTELAQFDLGNGARVMLQFRNTNSPQAALAGKVKIDFYGESVQGGSHWLADTTRMNGILTTIIGRLIPFYEAHGLVHYIAPPDPFVTWVHRLVGFDWCDEFRLCIDTRPRAGRYREYQDWKNALRPEPQWHIDLAATPPPQAGATATEQAAEPPPEQAVE